MTEIARFVSPDGLFTEFLMQAWQLRYTVTVTNDPDTAGKWTRDAIIQYRNKDLSPFDVFDGYDVNRIKLQRRQHRLHVGLGVQWQHASGVASTLQICIDKRVLIFQLSRATAVPQDLRSLLNDNNVDFVGFLLPSLVRRLLMRSGHDLALAAPLWDLKPLLPPQLRNQNLEDIVDARDGDRRLSSKQPYC